MLTMVTMNPVSERLRDARALAGISARELDALAGLGAGHTSMIEAGRRPNITADTARGIARVLGCTVGWLLAAEGDAPAAADVLAAVERARAAQADAAPPSTPEAA